MFSEFIQFLRKTNALALAVAVIIGRRIGKVVTSVVNDLLMPVIGLWLGGGDWRAWQIVSRPRPTARCSRPSASAASSGPWWTSSSSPSSCSSSARR